MNESTKETIKTLALLLGVIFSLATAITGIANYAVSQRLTVVQGYIQKVQAIESDYARSSTMETGFKHVLDKFDEMDKRLEKMEEKLYSLK